MTPRSGTTLIDPLIARAEQDPEAIALVFIAEDGVRTPLRTGEVHAQVLASARALELLGVAPDDVVILAMGHSPALIATFLGALYLGAVPSIFAYPTDKVDAAYAARVHATAMHVGARAIVTTPRLTSHLERQARAHGESRQIP